MVDHVDVGEVFLPGEIVSSVKDSEKTSKLVLGPGLKQEDDSVIVTKSGILRFKEPNFYWIDCHTKRYVPVKGDSVIGIVTAKAGDVFRLDIGGSELATLSYLAFEGSTKRNRPDVKVGDMVYTKCMVANKDMEPELVCIDSNGRSGGLGVIGRDGGFMIHTSPSLIKKILSPDCILLKTLGKNIQFEVAIGMNGRIWAKARSVSHTIAICNAISAAEYMSNEQIKTMCKKLINALAGF